MHTASSRMFSYFIHVCTPLFMVAVVIANDRSLSNDQNLNTVDKSATENGSFPSTEVINTTKSAPSSWYTEAIREIAYYLRFHKFNEYDRRYETNPASALRQYFRYFPKPPLRSLHWEVHKNCEPSFDECVEYLRKKIKLTNMRREDDTSVVIQELNWTLGNNSAQIKQVDEECKKAQKVDDLNALPFEGPIERFQWRTTASYYMCLYTMKGEPKLEHLSERCDNFANCLDTNLGPAHHDSRADDVLPFSCAMYSFCPDPCCGQKHLNQLEQCWESTDNPCYQENASGRRQCSVNRTENVEMRDMILNRWNVTCNCPREGYRWNSLYGMCVDVDECTAASHNCDPKLEACVNLQGGYRCACKWGHAWNQQLKKCSPSPALAIIKLHRNHTGNATSPRTSILLRILNVFRNNGTNKYRNIMTLICLICVVQAEVL